MPPSKGNDQGPIQPASAGHVSQCEFLLQAEVRSSQDLQLSKGPEATLEAFQAGQQHTAFLQLAAFPCQA